MKDIRFEDYLPFEKNLIYIGFFCFIVSMALLGLSLIRTNLDGFYTMIVIAVTLSIGIISTITALGNVLFRLYKG